MRWIKMRWIKEAKKSKRTVKSRINTRLHLERLEDRTVPSLFTWSTGLITQPPAISWPGDQANPEGDAVSLQVLGSDPEGKALTFAAIGLPKGLAISGTGIISGAIAYTDADLFNGEYRPTIFAVDGDGGSASTSFLWTITDTDRAPTLNSIADQSSQAGAQSSLQVSGSDPDGEEVWYAATGLPPGLSMAPLSGLISGTIDPAAGGTYPVTVTVGDGEINTTASFTWTVIPNSAPSVTSPDDQTNQEKDTVSLQVVASGGSLTYSAAFLPAGLGIDPNTGLISGTIASGAGAFGVHDASVTVSNGVVATTQSFKWTVQPYVTVDDISDQSTAEGEAVSLQVIAAVPGPSNTLIYSAAGLPAGLSIDSSTGLISGTVATGISKNGPNLVSVTATEGTYSASRTFLWTVTRLTNSGPTLTNPGNQTAVAGQDVTLPLSATDADGDLLTFTVTGLPESLSIDPEASFIGGVLQDWAVSTIPYDVTVTVDDGHGGTASVAFTWTVSDAALALQGQSATGVEGTELKNVQVATFTDARIGRPAAWYSITILWGDGTDSSGFAVASEASPGNFTVYGSHAYDRPGNYSLTVEVTTPAEVTTSTTTTASIANAALSLTAGLHLPFVSFEQPLQTIAVIVDSNPLRHAPEYTFTVNWGDQSGTGGGYVEGSDGLYLLKSFHNYTVAGDYTISITATDPDGQTASGVSYAHVGRLQAGRDANFTLYPLQTADPISSVSANVAWGDGTNSSATVSGSSSLFSVAGTHVYAADGQYTVVVTVSTPSEGDRLYQDTVRVVAGAITGAANPTDVIGSTSADREVALFASGNRLEALSPLTATISWGDDTSSTYTAPLANKGMVQLARAGQLVAVQPGQAPVPIGVPFPLQKTDLAHVLLHNFNAWADATVPGTGERYISLARVNTLIGSWDVRMWDAAAVAILKVFVHQAPNDLRMPGEFLDVFGADRKRNWPGGLTLNHIRTFDAILKNPMDPRNQRASRLNTIYNDKLAQLSLKLRDLFSNRVRSEDLWTTVRQGMTGDCAFMSSTIGYVKARGRPAIERRIRLAGANPNGQSLFDVDLFTDQGVPTTVRVAEPTDAERVLYGSATDGTPRGLLLWLPVFEKAYVQSWPRDNMRYRQISTSLYDVAADGQRVDEAILRVTGNRARWRTPGQLFPIDAVLRNTYLNQVNMGQVVVIGTRENLPADARMAGVPASHAFAVVAFDPMTGSITIRNPWNDASIPFGREQVITINDLRNWFSVISVQGMQR